MNIHYPKALIVLIAAALITSCAKKDVVADMFSLAEKQSTLMIDNTAKARDAWKQQAEKQRQARTFLAPAR